MRMRTLFLLSLVGVLLAAPVKAGPSRNALACYFLIAAAGAGVALYGIPAIEQQRAIQHNNQAVVQALSKEAAAVTPEVFRQTVRSAILAGIQKMGLDRVLNFVRDESRNREKANEAENQIRAAIINGTPIPEGVKGEQLTEISFNDKAALRFGDYIAYRYRLECDFDTFVAKRGVVLDDIYMHQAHRTGKTEAGQTSGIGHVESTAAATLEKNPEQMAIVIEAMIEFVSHQAQSPEQAAADSPGDAITERSFLLYAIQKELED